MRHRLGNRKLSRATDQRLALLRSIVRSLFIYGKVKVTLTRAKEARRMAERLITAAKSNNLMGRRKVESVLHDRAIVTQIFKTFPERFEGRPGGYTRITKLGARRGDAAPLALLELV
ncbi:50S ribosomal protein L17 [candidate division WOR-1 bacterium RIFCSPHIGHO2_01_FULL_53_15]|uniref:Large ribosomal subunit protein bL17 n=1 Tax=candidate division WOR-1 bacterium RIFCSPHIGHO2_01_FULL_53_15 TaxID=1802564 RepID=A0A1F4Q3Z5_UNCSA|nr:MAG: 50S ribosomal protein L17 [candidate division WOR-1 bacterium RIFCSPHIGHO2_01_FULL_53_15]OGC12489.1 MAG: 50S ribosomal protein L17 [candidate division WOR-1 bacterium RIFCSPHIGHO2_02_FULL_53_26]